MVRKFSCFFFFQAEDGIRDYKVTGVQTCALPIYAYERPDAKRAEAGCDDQEEGGRDDGGARARGRAGGSAEESGSVDRKSTRLNSSHLVISYAVFCLKKKKKKEYKGRATVY